MKRSFRDALAHRRSYYSIVGSSPISDEAIIETVEFAVRNMPSAFNSQSTRVVVLFGTHHTKLWDIVMQTLRTQVPADKFANTQTRIRSFAAGHGTLLFFEDQNVVESLQNAHAMYADNFPGWSLQTSAMHQLAIWTMLEDAGLGVSLQHYNPVIDHQVLQTWGLPDNWKLIAQMPFGEPTAMPSEKNILPIETRVLTFR